MKENRAMSERGGGANHDTLGHIGTVLLKSQEIITVMTAKPIKCR